MGWESFDVVRFDKCNYLPQPNATNADESTLMIDALLLNAATHNRQLWGQPVTSGRSCIPVSLQVPLISVSFPGPPSGTLTRSW